jgi:chromosome segregation protein
VLKLKKLQLQGFKSFCERTELLFPGTGVVGVVGPNGCGKSNLADAIGWVLGEQSAKSLRGTRMEDVIFAGTRDRPATGMAEVSLTLVDPEQYEVEAAPGTFPDASNDAPPAEAAEEGMDAGWDEDGDGAEAVAAPAAEQAAGQVVLSIRKRRRFIAHNRRGEIVVTRRLYRSGESEYLLNGRPCRLRDIQDIFLGTGLGPESYAIIEQGRIGQILSSRPYDRRAVIEEAAGISKYKVRRRAAESRLEAARLNLSRVNDIFEEVTRQTASLKRQSAKAERYRGYKTELDGRQRRLARGRAQAIETAQTGLREQHAAAAQAAQAAHDAIAAQEGARAQHATQCTALELELRRLTGESGRLQRERDSSAQQITFHEQQSAELERRGADLATEQTRLQQQQAALEPELEQARRDQDTAGEAAAGAAERFAACRAQHQAAQAQVAEAERGQAAARQQSLTLLRQAAQLENQIGQGETLIAGFERQLQRLAEDETTARGELDRNGVRRGQLDIEFQDQQSASAALAARSQELERRVAELIASEAQERKQGEQSRTRLAELSARRRSLEEIVAHHGYSSEAVKGLFGRRDAASFQPLGVLGEFLDVDAPYDQVLEQFLHDEMNFVVVPSWDQAGEGVGMLRSQEQGRATFLVHGDGHTTAPAAAAAPEPAAEPGLIPLLGEVKALNGFRRGLADILPKLRNAYLAADAAQARRLAVQYPHAFFLTAGGECYHNLTVSGGAGAGSGPLSLKRELRDLARREAEEQAALTRLDQRQIVLGRDRDQAERELAQTRNQRHEAEKRLLTSTQAAQQVEGELKRAEAMLQRAVLERERAQAEQQQTSQRLEAARHEAAAASAEAARLQQRESDGVAAVAAAAATRDTAAQAMSAAQTEAARIEERARAATAAWERLQRQQRDIATRIEAMVAEAQGLQTRQRELEAQRQILHASLERLHAELARATAAQASAEAALAAARVQVQQLENELAAGREAWDQKRQLQNECEVALARLEADLEHLRQSCREELGCELAQLAELDGAEPAPVAGELPALEAEVRELRQRIDNLGPVNMMALEEYEEARQRHEFLDTQRQDLLNAIADTQKAIQEMDTISRQKFQEAFEQINIYFQEMFQVLFGGGQGFLKMSEAEPDARGDSGVDIVAQPPGKKLQNALLLSGGEKAMTAMALLLAVFRYQPSPFCLLDEVDAPMDEANVARFSDMVKRMGAHTQFILITHNKRTMEAAPTLYGVTMPQAGISRLVSVQVESAPRAVAS